MATVQHYVNTASSGGDGTTNATSGANAAFASLASWEANVGAANSATDDYIVDCCGVPADTAAVTIDFATNITTGSITIRSNRSDPAGFYSGTEVISDQHYRLVLTGGFYGLRASERNVTIDGIQVVYSSTSINAVAIGLSVGDHIVENCRVLNGGNSDHGVGEAVPIGNNNDPRIVRNNLVVGFDATQIKLGITNFFTPAVQIYHNACYGNGSSTGIEFTGPTMGVPTASIVGNICENNATDISITVGSASVSSADNVTEDSSGQVTGSSPAATWVSPGTTAGSDFALKDASSPAYQVVDPTVVTTDLTGFTRDGTAHDAGPFELQSGGGGTTFFQACSGSLSATGSITKKTAKSFSSFVALSGGLHRKTSKFFGGSLTPSGTVGSVAVLRLLVQGTLTMTGAVRKLVRKKLSGALTGTGSVLKKTSKRLTGTLTPSGSVDAGSSIKLALAGSITAIGSLVTQFLAWVPPATGVISRISHIRRFMGRR